MKKRTSAVFLVLMFSLPPPAHTQQFIGVEYDKWLHFDTSALLSATVTQFEQKWGWDDQFRLLPIGSVILANSAKEFYDTTQPGGSWDWQDLRTGVLGGLFGVGLSSLWQTKPEPVLTDRSLVAAAFLSILLPGGGHFYRGSTNSGWSYLGLEAASLFPLLLTNPADQPTTYYGSAALLALLKIVEIVDAVLSSPSSSRVSLFLQPYGYGGRICLAF